MSAFDDDMDAGFIAPADNKEAARQRSKYMDVRVEYAGFQYDIKAGVATPVAGQHPAASKEKHRMAAVKEFMGQ